MNRYWRWCLWPSVRGTTVRGRTWLWWVTRSVPAVGHCRNDFMTVASSSPSSPSWKSSASGASGFFLA